MPAPRTAPTIVTLCAVAFLTFQPAPASAAEAGFAMVFPQDPVVTTYVDSWGFARSGGRRHEGTDLMAPKMTPVYSAADGVVTSVDEGGSAGRRLVIDHGGGWETWYLHLNNDTPGTDDGRADWSDTLAEGIEAGAAVTAGQLVAFVGDSGNAEWTGAHTHLELHREGTAINPYPSLLAAQEVAFAEMADDVVPRVADLVRSLGRTTGRLLGPYD